VKATAASLGFLKPPIREDFAFAGSAVLDAKVIGTGVRLAVREGDGQLRDELNEAFAAKRNGTYRTLLKKYFTVDRSVH
jgi:ABC-type amino acid transport substrate-binding protein